MTSDEQKIHQLRQLYRTGRRIRELQQLQQQQIREAVEGGLPLRRVAEAAGVSTEKARYTARRHG